MNLVDYFEQIVGCITKPDIDIELMQLDESVKQALLNQDQHRLREAISGSNKFSDETR